MFVPIHIRQGPVGRILRTAARAAVRVAVDDLWPTFNNAIDGPDVSTSGPTELRGELVQFNSVVQNRVTTLQLQKAKRGLGGVTQLSRCRTHIRNKRLSEYISRVDAIVTSKVKSDRAAAHSVEDRSQIV